MEIRPLLKNFGLNDKEVAVYLALIELGPSPVRTLAQKSGVNRGTAYDILKSLIGLGLAGYFNKQRKQYFVAEPPEKLITALEEKQSSLEALKREIKANLPELKLLFELEGGRPQVSLYEGQRGIKQILDDVLAQAGQSCEKMYYVYSAAHLRKSIFQAMQDFSQKRIKQNIRVRTISLGQGGQLVGLDERKWLPNTKQDLQATYELIYAGKVAHISLDKSENPVGVVIENGDIYKTQKLIFEFNWSKI